MKKLNKRIRTTEVILSVQQYDECTDAGERLCPDECRRLGADNYGMTFPRAEIATSARGN